MRSKCFCHILFDFKVNFPGILPIIPARKGVAEIISQEILKAPMMLRPARMLAAA
jgi:hypothetical protein